MNIQINYGTGVATLPTAALPILDRATKADVKVLFLLCAEPQLLTAQTREACLARIAERAGCTTAQVEASLSFWRGAGVLDTDEDAVVQIAPPVEPPAEQAPISEPAEEATPTSNVTVTRAKTRMLDEIPNYTTDELEAFLAERVEASTYLDECQNIWGDMFNPRETNIIIALVDTWGFQWEYVIALLAFAAKQFKEKENQGKSLNYVYRMAVGLHKEGVLTFDALREKFLEIEKTAEFEKRLRDMFGFGARTLTPKEKKYISTWLYEYHYDIEVVELAYNVTVDAKGSPNINYTNGVLKHWYEDGLKTAEEIIAKREADDATIREIKAGKESRVSAASTNPNVPAEPSDIPTGSQQDLGILRRLLGMQNRMLTEGETAAFERWRTEYTFTYAVIYYAYQITLENRGDYNLAYMDAILKKWNEQKLSTIDEIKAYEKGYKADRSKKRKEAPGATTGQSSFDTEDFFMAAVKRSLGEDFDPAILNQ